MRTNYQGISVLMDIISKDLDNQLEIDQIEHKDGLLTLIGNFIANDSTYEEALEFFNQLRIHSYVLDKVKQIIEVEDEPISSDDDQCSNDSSKKRKKILESREDIRLIAGVLRYGSEKWSDISNFVGNSRTASQCSQRWRRSLNPRVSKDKWSSDEECLLFQYVQQYGSNSWAKISSLLGTRSDVQCRYHYYQINKKIQDDAKLSNFNNNSTNVFISENLSEIHSKMNFEELLFDTTEFIPENNLLFKNFDQ